MQARWQAEKADSQRLAKLREEVDALHARLQQATERGDLEAASRLKYSEIPDLERQLKVLELAPQVDGVP